MKLDVEPLTLGNMSPAVDQQFQDSLALIVDAFHNCEALEKTSGGEVKGSITLSIDLVYNPQGGAVFVSSRVQHKLPRRVSNTDAIKLYDTGLYTEVNKIQETPMFGRSPEAVSHRSRPIPMVSAQADQE